MSPPVSLSASSTFVPGDALDASDASSGGEDVALSPGDPAQRASGDVVEPTAGVHPAALSLLRAIRDIGREPPPDSLVRGARLFGYATVGAGVGGLAGFALGGGSPVGICPGAAVGSVIGEGAAQWQNDGRLDPLALSVSMTTNAAACLLPAEYFLQRATLSLTTGVSARGADAVLHRASPEVALRRAFDPMAIGLDVVGPEVVRLAAASLARAFARPGAAGSRSTGQAPAGDPDRDPFHRLHQIGLGDEESALLDRHIARLGDRPRPQGVTTAQQALGRNGLDPEGSWVSRGLPETDWPRIDVALQDTLAVLRDAAPGSQAAEDATGAVIGLIAIKLRSEGMFTPAGIAAQVGLSAKHIERMDLSVGASSQVDASSLALSRVDWARQDVQRALAALPPDDARRGPLLAFGRQLERILDDAEPHTVASVLRAKNLDEAKVTKAYDDMEHRGVAVPDFGQNEGDPVGAVLALERVRDTLPKGSRAHDDATAMIDKLTVLSGVARAMSPESITRDYRIDIDRVRHHYTQARQLGVTLPVTSSEMQAVQGARADMQKFLLRITDEGSRQEMQAAIEDLTRFVSVSFVRDRD